MLYWKANHYLLEEGNAMANVRLKDICKTYPGGVHAVNNFSLDIADREFVVFVGPSGCGKSTTLRMIAGLEDISSGQLYIGDKLANEVAPKDRDIAMVFQNYALYPHMSVYDNMAFALKIRGLPKPEIRKRVEEAAEQLEIGELLSRKPKALSGGQRQRVALGRAVVRHPSVFLLDEPLSNLDAKLRVSMRGEIAKLHKRTGTTFIYVTHDQTEAMTMGDRIVVMKDGIIQQVDTPGNIYSHPRNQFVASFMGTPSMNFLPAAIQKRGDGFMADIRGFKTPVPATPSLNGFTGREVTLGIRPEDMSLADGEEALTAGLVLNELMGAECYLHLEFAGQELILRAPAREQYGDRVGVKFQTDKIHLFDPADGRTIV